MTLANVFFLSARSLSAATAMLLAGCSIITAPSVTLAPTPDAKLWHTHLPDGVQYEEDSDTQEPRPDALASWWTVLHDPTLNELLQQVLDNNPSMHSAGINHRLAMLKAGVASAAYAPKANLGLNGSASQPLSGSSDQRTPSYGLNLGASWELDLWGGVAAQRSQAEASVLRAVENIRAAQVSLIAETVQAYINLRMAQENKRLAREAIRFREESYNLVKWERSAGLKTELEQSQALTLWRQSQAQLPPYEQAEQLALQQLQALAGGDLSVLMSSLQTADSLPFLRFNEALRIPAEVLRQRPDVRAQELMVQEQAQAVALARINRFPSFSLSGSIGSSSDHFSDIFDIDNMIARLAASLSYVLFDGGSLRFSIEQSKLQLEQALINYRSQLLTAQQEAEGALTRLDASQRQQNSYQQALESAQLAADLAAMQYQAGLLDFSDLLTTQSALLNARSAMLSNQSSILSSRVQLYRSLGGGWQGLDLPAVALNAGEAK